MYLKDFIENLEGSLGGVTLHNGQLFSPPFFPPHPFADCLRNLKFFSLLLPRAISSFHGLEPAWEFHFLL